MLVRWKALAVELIRRIEPVRVEVRRRPIAVAGRRLYGVGNWAQEITSTSPRWRASPWTARAANSSLRLPSRYRTLPVAPGPGP